MRHSNPAPCARFGTPPSPRISIVTCHPAEPGSPGAPGPDLQVYGCLLDSEKNVTGLSGFGFDSGNAACGCFRNTHLLTLSYFALAMIADREISLLPALHTGGNGRAVKHVWSGDYIWSCPMDFHIYAGVAFACVVGKGIFLASTMTLDPGDSALALCLRQARSACLPHY